MNQPKSTEECKKILFKLGIKYGVPPKLISERLLSREDKEDMLQGLISAETLDFWVKVWKEQGMCNHADGTGSWYSDFDLYAGVWWGYGEKVALQSNLTHRN